MKHQKTWSELQFEGKRNETNEKIDNYIKFTLGFIVFIIILGLLK